MVDQFDRAQELEQIAREKAIEAARAKRLTGESARECECGAVIPEARRLALPGVKVCVDCQALNEERTRRGLR